ncbi:MAG: urease accessory protein UreH [Pyrinomonadaceae bacterium]
MEQLSLISILGLGFVLGLKHAVDADHLAAVATLTSERRSLLSSLFIGVLWGVGHTISLMMAGILVIFLHLQITELLKQSLEFVVAIMLVALGANALRKLARGGHVHMHVHEHGGHMHAHPHVHGNNTPDPANTHHELHSGLRPLIIGGVHGLAGSAALILLVLTTISSAIEALLYIALFGLGSIGGMMILSTLLALPARLTVQRFSRVNLAVRCTAAVLSLSLGVLMIYQIGFVNHLLL